MDGMNKWLFGKHSNQEKNEIFPENHKNPLITIDALIHLKQKILRLLQLLLNYLRNCC